METTAKQYYVYSTDFNILESYGEVYYPKIKMSFVILTTGMQIHEIWKIDGVYEVKECEKGSLSSL